MTSKGSFGRGGLRPFKPAPFGRFTLLAPLAAGGMGEIYLAKSTFQGGLEKLCVIKKVIPALASDEEFIGRFLDEAKLLVKLQHGSIAQVYDTGLEVDEYWIALEFVDGKDVRRIEQRTRDQKIEVPLDCAAYVGTKVLEALAYAHRKKDEDGRELNLVHRDVSPQNVLVSYEGEVKVIDFGLAKSKLSAGRTQPSMVLGKFYYMAPEQARNQPVDRRSDIYAVGVLLYELIVGKNPYEDVPPFEVMERVASPKIPPLSEAAPRCPAALAGVVMKALAPNPADRFQTAEEMRGRLTASLYEISPDAGPEKLAAYVRDAFAEEFARERKMIALFSQARVGDAAIMVPVLDVKAGPGERTESFDMTAGEVVGGNSGGSFTSSHTQRFDAGNHTARFDAVVPREERETSIGEAPTAPPSVLVASELVAPEPPQARPPPAPPRALATPGLGTPAGPPPQRPLAGAAIGAPAASPPQRPPPSGVSGVPAGPPPQRPPPSGVSGVPVGPPPQRPPPSGVSGVPTGPPPHRLPPSGVSGAPPASAAGAPAAPPSGAHAAQPPLAAQGAHSASPAPQPPRSGAGPPVLAPNAGGPGSGALRVAPTGRTPGPAPVNVAVAAPAEDAPFLSESADELPFSADADGPGALTEHEREALAFAEEMQTRPVVPTEEFLAPKRGPAPLSGGSARAAAEQLAPGTDAAAAAPAPRVPIAPVRVVGGAASAPRPPPVARRAGGDMPWDPTKSGTHSLQSAAKVGTTGAVRTIPWEERPPPPPATKVQPPPEALPPMLEGEEGIADESAAFSTVRASAGLSGPRMAPLAPTPKQRSPLPLVLLGAVITVVLLGVGLWLSGILTTAPEPSVEPPPAPAVTPPSAVSPGKPATGAADPGRPVPAATAAGKPGSAQLKPEGQAEPAATKPEHGATKPEHVSGSEAGAHATPAAAEAPREPGKPPTAAAEPEARRPKEPATTEPRSTTREPKSEPKSEPKDAPSARKKQLQAQYTHLESDYQQLVEKYGAAKVGSFVNTVRDRVASSYRSLITSPERYDELEVELNDFRSTLAQRRSQFDKR